jgi:hypothetical protein
MKNIFPRKRGKKSKTPHNGHTVVVQSSKATTVDLIKTTTSVFKVTMASFHKNNIANDEQIFAYLPLQPSIGMVRLDKTSKLDEGDDDDDYDGYSPISTEASNIREASERSINVVTIGETPLDVFLQSFRNSGSEFVSSAYLLERSIDTYGGSLSTSLPEDVFTLVDTQVCLLSEYLHSSGLSNTDTGDAVVVDAMLNVFRILHVKQRHYRDFFLRNVDSCIAASNDFLRMADKAEQVMEDMKDDYAQIFWSGSFSSHKPTNLTEWDVTTDLLEQEASHLIDLYQQDAVLAAQRSALYIIESIQQSDIPNQLFSYAWEEEWTDNQVSKEIVQAYAEMLASLEPLIASEYLFHKVISALVRSTVCFYIQCFLMKADKARRHMGRPIRSKTTHSFVNPPRAVMRMSHDTKVLEEFFLDVAQGNGTLRRIISNEMSLLKVVVLECMSYATGQNGSDTLAEFIVVVHKRTGADRDVTRHFLSDIYALLGKEKKGYLFIENKVNSMKEELDKITLRVKEERQPQQAGTSEGDALDSRLFLDKMLKMMYEEKILHEKLSLCGNLMADVHSRTKRGYKYTQKSLGQLMSLF